MAGETARTNSSAFTKAKSSAFFDAVDSTVGKTNQSYDEASRLSADANAAYADNVAANKAAKLRDSQPVQGDGFIEKASNALRDSPQLQTALMGAGLALMQGGSLTDALASGLQGADTWNKMKQEEDKTILATASATANALRENAATQADVALKARQPTDLMVAGIQKQAAGQTNQSDIMRALIGAIPNIMTAQGDTPSVNGTLGYFNLLPQLNWLLGVTAPGVTNPTGKMPFSQMPYSDATNLQVMLKTVLGDATIPDAEKASTYRQQVLAQYPGHAQTLPEAWGQKEFNKYITDVLGAEQARLFFHDKQAEAARKAAAAARAAKNGADATAQYRQYQKQIDDLLLISRDAPQSVEKLYDAAMRIKSIKAKMAKMRGE